MVCAGVRVGEAAHLAQQQRRRRARAAHADQRRQQQLRHLRRAGEFWVLAFGGRWQIAGVSF